MPRSRDLVDRILAFNAGREPQRLQMKYDAIRTGAFRFLRGTCHLFYEDFPRHSALNAAPHAWISGDLHLENFGSYKGDDRIIYFDINDFDEAVLAPCTWELARFTTSVFLGARDYGIAARGAMTLCRTFLDAYGEALVRGKARRVERLVAEGPVRTLLDALLTRPRLELLDKRTERRGGRRTLRLGKRALPVTAEQRRMVTTFMRGFAKRQQHPVFFRVLDVARRVAGTGSLGVQRFVVLVEGKGSPDDNWLIDLKEARPTALAPYAHCPQPAWKTEADRVVTIQDRMQAAAPALLASVVMGRTGYILRELQPTEDRLALAESAAKPAKLASVLRTMGSAVAWSQLRSAGRQGSQNADDLIAFAGKRGWVNDTLTYAQHYARQVVADWQVFRKAAESGRVPLPSA